MARVLIVDDEEGIRTFLAETLARHEVVVAADAESALVAMARGAADVVITDVRMPWPGNVRELVNVLERGAILAEGNTLLREHLALPQGGPAPARARSLADVERAAIEAALAESGGNRRRAAEVLGIGLRTLYEKLKEYGG